MDSDEQLYQRVKGGDMAAFDTLYARYAQRIFSFVYAQIHSRADAEEILQDAFYNCLDSREVRFVDGGTFRSWLYRIARNLVLNRLRTQVRAAKVRLVEDEPPPSVEQQAISEERLVALQKAVQKLPEPLAEVYRLRTTGLSYEEMAQVLEVPLGTLKSRLHQLVFVLKKELASWTV